MFYYLLVNMFVCPLGEYLDCFKFVSMPKIEFNFINLSFPFTSHTSLSTSFNPIHHTHCIYMTVGHGRLLYIYIILNPSNYNTDILPF